MTNEAEENRRILAAIAGGRLIGGCSDCQAYSVVHYGVLTEDGQDVTPASGLSGGVYRLCVYHDNECPHLHGATA